MARFVNIRQGPPRWDIIQHEHDRGPGMGGFSDTIRFTIKDPETGEKGEVKSHADAWIRDDYAGGTAYFIAGLLQGSPIGYVEDRNYVGYFNVHSRLGWMELYSDTRDGELEESIRQLENLLRQPLNSLASRAVRLGLAMMRHDQAVQGMPGGDPRYGMYDRHSTRPGTDQ